MSDEEALCNDGCSRAVFCGKCKQQICTRHGGGCNNAGYHAAPEGPTCVRCHNCNVIEEKRQSH